MAGEEEPQRVEQSLRIKSFDGVPSPDLFSSQIEPSNVPAVFHGAVKEWDAFAKWDPRNGGLDYLQERVGSNVVEAMFSRSAPVFYGDLRSHERVPLSFSSFLTSCKSCLNTGCGRNPSDFGRKSSEMTTDIQDEACTSSMTAPETNKIYLAQVPIVNVEHKEKTALEALREDIEMPACLELKSLMSINFWMNNVRSRSSTHYDPQHNLLCVVSGCKQVALWPPSASPMLYPMPIYGEASNHSAVNLEGPDLSLHPRAKHSIDFSQKAVLQAGDALFIPEGWFHQVDSDDLTIAVNFWWQSSMISNMLEHMDAYYLRRISNRLVGKEMDHILFRNSKEKLKAEEILHTSAPSEGGSFPCNSVNESGEDNKENGSMLLENLEPLTLQALHELVSLVHHNVNVDQSQSLKLASEKAEQGCTPTVNNDPLEYDPVAGFLLALQPPVLNKIILAMVHNFPRTLEALVLHMLSPAAAEILTRKFDEMDKQTTKEQQEKFYQQLYSAFDDKFAAMDALLSGKEAFSFQAFRNVLDQYLGVTVDQPKSLGRS